MPESLLEQPYAYAFQPVRSLYDGTPHHYEALFRSSDVTVSTGTLIESFEQSGAIGLLDRRGVKHLSRIADRLALPIAVNVSASSVEDSAFHGHVHDILRRMCRPSQLHFEMTETQPLNDFQAAAEFVRLVKRFNCQIALDDYGTGYMSPRHVTELGADLVKIDSSIIQGIQRDSDQRVSTAFVLETVALARLAGARVIAEGIETAGMHREAAFLGIDLGQGYYLGRPDSLQSIAKTHRIASTHRRQRAGRAVANLSL